MSIFKKITLLFLISLLLMLLIGYQIDKINTQRVEALVVQKYLQDAKKVFFWIATESSDRLEKKLNTLNLSLLDANIESNMQTLLIQPHSFGELNILKTEDGKFLLFIRYIDDTLLLSDNKLQNSLQNQWLLNLLVALDIFLLLVMFFIILKILSPLKHIISKMQDFAKGDYKSRVNVKGKDEISEVATTYNMMAQKLEDFIISKEEFLRDVAHELRTPIAKGLFAVEALDSSKSKDIIHKSFTELERLSSEFLEIEKLHNMESLQIESFKVETLILQSLSKLICEDESKISIDIRNDFTILADLNYLSLALKNLIDNAIKYSSQYPIVITVDNEQIAVKNRAKELNKDISYYLQAFTREENLSESEGHGLGLNIVKKVLDKHHLELNYKYIDGWHVFTICFNKKTLSKSK